jgi:predicted negative regulator of RcsB-dependent stress response
MVKNYLLRYGWVLLLVSLLLVSRVRAAEGEAGEAAFYFSPRLQQAYAEIQKLRLDSARRLLEQERARQPGNGVLHYLDNYADLHYLLLSEDKAAYTRLSGQQEVRLAALARLPESSPFQRLYMAEVRLHWAFVKLKFGQEVSASWDIIKAYRLLDENSRKYPQFIPTYKSLGLLHVLIGSVPENFSWVPLLLGLRGNVQQGLRELRMVQQKDAQFRQEAQLIDLLLHAYTLRLGADQLQELKYLPARSPDNLLLHFFAASVLMKEGRSEEALGLLQKAPDSPDYLPFPFLDYLRGDLLLQSGKYPEAAAAYRQFQAQFKGVNFIKDAYHKRYLCRWLSEQPGDPEGLLQKVLKEGRTIVEADQSAQRFAEKYLAGQVTTQQKVLMKARLATDGGYLTRAREALAPYQESSFGTLAERAEYNYRLGRIMQKMEQPERALPYLERSVVLTQNTNLYVGASAALQLGYLYREKQQRERAIAYFRRAMSYKKHEYKNSIDNKARAALTELGA